MDVKVEKHLPAVPGFASFFLTQGNQEMELSQLLRKSGFPTALVWPTFQPPMED